MYNYLTDVILAYNWKSGVFVDPVGVLMPQENHFNLICTQKMFTIIYCVAVDSVQLQ